MNNVVIKKNIILIPADYDGVSNQKGVLSLEFKQNKAVGTLRCYNVKPTDEVYNVGVQVGENTFKTKASAKELSNLRLEIDAVGNNTTKISVVIVSLNGKKYNTLLWGSTETTKALQEHILIQNLLEKTQILNSQALNMENNNIQSQNVEEKQQEIFENEILENYIDKVFKETDDSVKQDVKSFSKSFLENSNISSTPASFYSKVEGQINSFFENNQKDVVLESIIPDSRFCKVDLDDGYYVFGVIYENGKEKCICYGVPCDYYGEPPKDIEGYSQWLPVDVNNYQGKGYWLTYQDAKTGENISVEII